MNTTRISIRINDQFVSQEVTPRTHLGDFIRDQVKLTGTHLGCEHGVCGACTVLLDGKPVRSCITYAASCDGHAITTIEGFDTDPIMSRLRKKFSEHHALQCGYCTPGMLTTSRDIVLRLPEADEHTVRAELSGNLCRCTGYVGIVGAIMAVLSDLKLHPDADVDKLRALIKAGHGGALKQASSTGAQSPSYIGFDALTPTTSARVESPLNKHTAGAKIQPGQGTQIRESFDLPFSADQVWQLMIDLPNVARCLPGATVHDMQGNHVNGNVSVKFGPMKASFEGTATLDWNDSLKSATLTGTGNDRLSQSHATGQVSYHIESLSAQTTRIHVDMTYTLQGPLAQFSRSGMVQEFVRRLVKDFAKNIEQILRDPASATSLPHRELHPFSLFLQIIFDRLRGLFSSKSK